MSRTKLVQVALISLGAMACGEGSNLFISVGAPATGVIRGVITDCGTPVASAEVLVLVQQDLPEQVRPVNAQIGPITTSRQGGYLVEIGPSFAVPGPASVRLRVTADGVTRESDGFTVELQLGRPARDTVRLDADLGQEQGVCGSPLSGGSAPP